MTSFSAETVDFLIELIYGVSDTESTDLGELLRVGEFIRQFHALDQISRDSSGQFEKVVLDKVFRKPKCNVLEEFVWNHQTFLEAK